MLRVAPIRPLAAALATLGPADRTAGPGGGGSAAATTRGGRGGGSGSGGGGEAVHPERQRRVQREMMSMIKRPHQVMLQARPLHTRTELR